MTNPLFRKSKEKTLKIGLFGLGKSNLGVLGYLKEKNLNFELTLRSDKNISTDIFCHRSFIGSGALSDIDEDIIFLSPSVRRDRAELKIAEKRGTLLFSDAELFFSLAKNRVFAVTGSDGKSTTTYLISELLRASGIDAVPAGNYGVSLSSLIGKACDVVAELSSFQLSYMKPKSYAAVITNITPNHLNWHKSLEEYVSAKENIIPNTERLALDYDSKLIAGAAKRAELFAVTSLELSYGELSRAVRAENYLTVKDSAVYLNGKPYFSIDGAQRRENYNIRNYLLAAAATLGLTAPETTKKVLNSFGGLAHRAQLIAKRGGISYINSSIDSSPERTLKTLRAIDGNVAVILCGRGKGLSADMLANELPTLTVGAVLMGDVGDEIEKLIKGKNDNYSYARANSMRDAVRLAASFLAGRGTVILSPAGTSFDKYKNFEERGRDFESAVYELTQ